MTYKIKGSIDCLYHAILDDILKASEVDLQKELTEATGKSVDELRGEFFGALEKAKNQVIERKMAELASAQKNVVAFSKRPSAPAANQPVTVLTLAARNAKRPLGFSDPSVDEDLAELRSENWEDE